MGHVGGGAQLHVLRLFDLYLFPDISHQLVAIRFCFSVVFLFRSKTVARGKKSLEVLHLVAALSILSGGVGWLVFAMATEYTEPLSQFMVFERSSFSAPTFSSIFRFWLSAVTSAIVTIAFVYALMFEINTDIVQRIVLSAFFINCLVLSLYLSWRLSEERYFSFIHSLQAQIQEKVAIEKGQQLEKIAETDPLTGLRKPPRHQQTS